MFQFICKFGQRWGWSAQPGEIRSLGTFRPYRYNPAAEDMSEHYAILSATGADRPGLLDEISQFLLERGGKIQDIRVANLGGQFSFLARLSGTEAALAQIKREIG